MGWLLEALLELVPDLVFCWAWDGEAPLRSLLLWLAFLAVIALSIVGLVRLL